MDGAHLTAIDLFCGAGGLSYGFAEAGYRIGFALDSDPNACETFALNHPGTHVENALIDDLTPEEILRLSGGVIDVVLGGPSCQGFSTRPTQSIRNGERSWHGLLA
jgi:DNA (cytosine-5)-methyltransferase 1